MGYRSLIHGLVEQAITSTLGDLSSTVTFKQITVGAYDPVAGVASKTVKTVTCRCALVGLKQSDVVIDLADHERNLGGVSSTDRKMLVPSVQLVGVNVDSLTDEVIVNGVTYHIFATTLDPSGSLYSFILHAAAGTKLNGI